MDAAWLEERLAHRSADALTVVYHSVFYQYPPREARERIAAAIEQAGRAAPAPLAWLRLEPGAVLGGPRESLRFLIDLITWPGGERRTLGTTDGHVRFVSGHARPHPASIPGAISPGANRNAGHQPRRRPLQEGVDVALRVRANLDDSGSLVVKNLGPTSALLVASPQLLQRVRRPAAPEVLHDLPTLAISAADGRASWHWVGPRGEEFDLQHRPVYIADDLLVLKFAALQRIE